MTAGHILELGNDKADKEYWICLSPACDLVPGQKTSGLFGRVKGSMPFTIVQLTKTGGRKPLKMLATISICFLTSTMKLILFLSWRTITDPASLGTDYCREYGQFKNMVKELHIWRVGGFENDGIVMKKHSARIVAQFQYEYALNLLQRFGATMSRVGLDFLNNQIVIVLPMSN